MSRRTVGVLLAVMLGCVAFVTATEVAEHGMTRQGLRTPLCAAAALVAWWAVDRAGRRLAARSPGGERGAGRTRPLTLATRLTALAAAGVVGLAVTAWATPGGATWSMVAANGVPAALVAAAIVVAERRRARPA